MDPALSLPRRTHHWRTTPVSRSSRIGRRAIVWVFGKDSDEGAGGRALRDLLGSETAVSRPVRWAIRPLTWALEGHRHCPRHDRGTGTGQVSVAPFEQEVDTPPERNLASALRRGEWVVGRESALHGEPCAKHT